MAKFSLYKNKKTDKIWWLDTVGYMEEDATVDISMVKKVEEDK